MLHRAVRRQRGPDRCVISCISQRSIPNLCIPHVRFSSYSNSIDKINSLLVDARFSPFRMSSLTADSHLWDAIVAINSSINGKLYSTSIVPVLRDRVGRDARLDAPVFQENTPDEWEMTK